MKWGAETADCRNLLNTDFLRVVICNIIGNQAQLFLRIFFKITVFPGETALFFFAVNHKL